MTIDEWLKREITFRMTVQRMTQKQVAESLGYTVRGLRNVCIRLKIPLSCQYIVKNKDIIMVYDKRK